MVVLGVRPANLELDVHATLSQMTSGDNGGVPMSPDAILLKVMAAYAASDYREVLKWEGRVEELLEGRSDDVCVSILKVFIFN